VLKGEFLNTIKVEVQKSTFDHEVITMLLIRRGILKKNIYENYSENEEKHLT